MFICYTVPYRVVLCKSKQCKMQALSSLLPFLPFLILLFFLLTSSSSMSVNFCFHICSHSLALILAACCVLCALSSELYARGTRNKGPISRSYMHPCTRSVARQRDSSTGKQQKKEKQKENPFSKDFQFQSIRTIFINTYPRIHV